MSHQQLVSTRFDGQAGRWRDLYEGQQDVFADIHRARRAWALRTISRLEPGTDSAVLEAGVGAGGFAASLAATGLRVCGVDGSARMLELTRQSARAGGVDGRVEVVQADASRLPFPDRSFPIVVALGLLPWVDDAGRVLDELARVTAVGGHVVVNTDNPRRLTHALDPRMNPRLARVKQAVASWLGRPHGVSPRGQTVAQIHGMVERAGLDLVYVHTLGFGPFTIAGHGLLPRRAGRVVNQALQRLADRGAVGLRSAGCMNLVLARRPAR